MTSDGYAFVACATAAILSAMVVHNNAYVLAIAAAWFFLGTVLAVINLLDMRSKSRAARSDSDRDRPPWI